MNEVENKQTNKQTKTKNTIKQLIGKLFNIFVPGQPNPAVFKWNSDSCNISDLELDSEPWNRKSRSNNGTIHTPPYGDEKNHRGARYRDLFVFSDGF